MLPTGLSPLLHKGLFLTALQGMVFEKLFLLDSTLRLPAASFQSICLEIGVPQDLQAMNGVA